MIFILCLSKEKSTI